MALTGFNIKLTDRDLNKEHQPPLPFYKMGCKDRKISFKRQMEKNDND
jgi:hypothetical protein